VKLPRKDSVNAKRAKIPNINSHPRYLIETSNEIVRLDAIPS
jgi:hypothetical protein